MNKDLNFISALNEGNELAHDMKKKGNSLFLQAIYNIASYFFGQKFGIAFYTSSQ